MKENWELLAIISALAVYLGHEFLHNGFHQEIPLDGEVMSVGAGLAALAIVGVGVNAYVYHEQDG